MTSSAPKALLFDVGLPRLAFTLVPRGAFRGAGRWLRFLLVLLVLAAPAMGWAQGPNDGLPRVSGASLDRGTPRRAFDGLMATYRRGDFALAAHYLDLRGLPTAQQGTQGPELARELGYVFDRKLAIDAGALSDEPDGGEKTANGALTIGTIFIDEEPVKIGLTHVRFDDGISRWVVSRSTVSMAGELYTVHGPQGLEERVPNVLRRFRFFGIEAWQWIAAIAAVLGSLVVGALLSAVLGAVAGRIVRRTRVSWDDLLVKAARGPSRLVIAGLILLPGIQALRLTPWLDNEFTRGAVIAIIAGIGWFLMRALAVIGRTLASNLPQSSLERRGVLTQLAVMERIGAFIIWVVASALVLMQFAFVRNVGVSLLASAGVLGVVIGFAAQKSLGGIVAGIQISLTQPIRMGDAVVIEGEFGTIEEINLTYVMIELWDQRRLVVPIQRFLEQPFQNWTRVGTQVLGGATLYVDHLTPIGPLREELDRICRASTKWDHRVCNLQIVEVRPQGLELRALVSGANAGDLWDLRCEVREKMMEFIRALEGGRYLVRSRVEAAPPGILVGPESAAG